MRSSYAMSPSVRYERALRLLSKDRIVNSKLAHKVLLNYLNRKVMDWVIYEQMAGVKRIEAAIIERNKIYWAFEKYKKTFDKAPQHEALK